MRRKADDKTRIDLGHLCEVFDRVNADKSLRVKTLEDVIRARDGEITKATVYRNLARRVEAAQNGPDVNG